MTDPILDGRVVAILDRVDALCRHFGVPGYSAIPSQPLTPYEAPEEAQKRFAEYLKAVREKQEKLLAEERAAKGKGEELDSEDLVELDRRWMAE